MNDPFYSGPKAPKVERRLVEAPLESRPTDQDADKGKITQKKVTALYDAFGYEINRATALIRAVEPRAKKLVIPVDADAVGVRAAIRRKMEGASGVEIPFDLYKDMLDWRVKTARKMKFEVVSELTGDTLTDATKIKKYLKTGGRGLSQWEEFLLSMEQFALWFLLNQLLGQFSCVEHQEVCAAKNPPATEVGPVQMRHAIAIAAMMLIMGMQEDHVMRAVQAPADALKIPSVDIINRARALTKTDLHRELNEIVGASDPQLIIDYCDNYIARHPIGYEDWMAYRDLRNIREYTVTTYIHGHQFSKEYSTLLDYSFEGQHTTPLPSGPGLGGFLGVPGRRAVVQYADTTTDMPPEHYVALTNQLSDVDRNISMIAGVLTNGYALELLCCVGRFLGREDIERLKRMRTILQVAYNFQTNGIAALADPANVMDFVVTAVQQALLAFAERYFDKVAKDMLGWVGSTDEHTWQDLFACPLIEDLVLQVLGAVSRLRDQIFELIRQFTGRAFSFGDNVYKRWGMVYDARRLKTIMAIIDRLLAAIEACANLDRGGGDGGENDPNPGEDPTVYDGVPQPLKLPPEVIQKFFPNPNPVVRPDGLRPVPPVGRIQTPGDPSDTRNFREICRGILPDELLEAVLKQREQV